MNKVEWDEYLLLLFRKISEYTSSPERENELFHKAVEFDYEKLKELFKIKNEKNRMG